MLRSKRALAACLLALLMPAAPAAAWAPAREGEAAAGAAARVPARDGDGAAGAPPATAWTLPTDGGRDPAYHDQQPAPRDPAEWPPTAPPAQAAPPPAGGPVEPVLPTTTQRTVVGRTAMLRTDGLAAIPRGAPKRVRAVIAAANRIIGKPYKWGGGHRRLDSGYDCSGAVSYALIRSRQQRGAMVSGQLAHAYAAGVGRFVTIYAHSTHVYMEVAGLRLDTSPYGDILRQAGVRWRPVVGQRPGFAVRHLAGL